MGAVGLPKEDITEARLPYLADDLFINYDDKRAVTGFRALAAAGR